MSGGVGQEFGQPDLLVGPQSPVSGWRAGCASAGRRRWRHPVPRGWLHGDGAVTLPGRTHGGCRSRGGILGGPGSPPAPQCSCSAENRPSVVGPLEYSSSAVMPVGRTAPQPGSVAAPVLAVACGLLGSWDSLGRTSRQRNCGCGSPAPARRGRLARHRPRRPTRPLEWSAREARALESHHRAASRSPGRSRSNPRAPAHSDPGRSAWDTGHRLCRADCPGCCAASDRHQVVLQPEGEAYGSAGGDNPPGPSGSDGTGGGGVGPFWGAGPPTRTPSPAISSPAWRSKKLTTTR